jgi:methyl-accepting chemotaxis protein
MTSQVLFTNASNLKECELATGADKRTLSLKNKLVLGGVASVLIPFIIAGSIIYVQLSSSLLDVTKGMSLNIAQEISSSINEAVNQEIRLAMSIAADPVILNAAKTDQFEDAETKIKAIYNRIGKKYHTIFLLNKLGTITVDSTFPLKIGLDLAERVYYQQARKGLAGVDGPILTKGDTTLGPIIIVVYAPIMDNDGFYGVVCLPFNMNYLLEITTRKKIGRTGFAQIINRDGLVVAHPQKERILSLSVISQARSEEMQRLVRGRTDGTASHHFDGKDIILGLSFTKWNGWIAVFTQEKDEIMYPMNRILYSILICGLFFLLVTILTIVFFSERISAPIQKMMNLRKLQLRK